MSTERQSGERYPETRFKRNWLGSYIKNTECNGYIRQKYFSLGNIDLVPLVLFSKNIQLAFSLKSQKKGNL